MKKLTFLFALVFAVSMALGQTAVINQTNTNVGPGTSGFNDNVADVTQTGLNTVKINQVQNITGTPGGAGLVSATVKQTGTKDNLVKINQTHDGTKNNGVGDLTVYAEQKGGKENTIIQTQHAGIGNWGNVQFSAIQDGDKNKATQTSHSNAGNDNGSILQKQSSNVASQEWFGTNYREGVNGDLFIEQDGNRNKASQTFLAGTVFSSGTFNRGVAQITQKGNDNIAKQKQQGAGNMQYLKQIGNLNEATMEAYGNYNLSDARQLGTNGKLKIIQKQDALGEAAEGIVADGNSVMISQDGNLSKADIMQDGLRNSVEGLGGTGTYAINNNGAFLKVSQTGMDNTVQSRQLVAGSETVTQVGMNNLSIVNQY